VALKHPVLSNFELEKIRSIDTGLFQAKTIQCYFRADGKPGSLKRGVERICDYAEDAVMDGFKVLILQDRAIDSNHAPIPSLLATSAIHHHLIRKGLRGQVGIVKPEMYGSAPLRLSGWLWCYRGKSLSRISSIRDLKERVNCKPDEDDLRKIISRPLMMAC
jgi:glutamate synthase (NADPH/NADH) large chain